MQINPIQLDIQNRLLKDYYAQTDWIQSHFTYNPFQNNAYQNRMSDIQSKSWQRDHLADVLQTMNQKWGASQATLNNIERLRRQDSTVVIAGQQAGLLTGPLYSLNKMISVIQFAAHQEQKQQSPVIPVFWIAGEDHDFAEINHVFMPGDHGMKKMPTSQRVEEGRPVSDIEISADATQEWLDMLFAQMSETAQTKALYKQLQRCLGVSHTYVDFFAQIINLLFPHSGLVLLDSASCEMRRLESDFFVNLINKQPDIAAGVHHTVEQLKQNGYNLSLDTTADDGHLFYHVDNIRYLLMRENETGDWISKQGDVRLSNDELISLAKNEPERLSNNVITRPLMQEWLFPTLAFLGGPGEIAYWAALKPAFLACDLDMPPVVPRKSFTFVAREVEAALEKHHIATTSAIESGVSAQKMAWLAAQQEPPVTDMVTQIKHTIDTLHSPLRQTAEAISPDIGDFAQTNIEHINRELDLLEKRMTDAIKMKYAHEIAEFDKIEQQLHPQGNLQERVWNPLPFLNYYGTDFVEKLAETPWIMDRQHIVVYL